MGTTSGDHVVVAADAAATARNIFGLARAVNTLLTQASAMTAALSNPQIWDGAAAERFRARNETLLNAARAAGRTVETTSMTALASIEGIDNADVVDPVKGWDYAKDGRPTVGAAGAYQPDHGNDYGQDENKPIASPRWVAHLKSWAEQIAFLSNLDPGTDASHFFQHYLDGTGSDLDYNSTAPYETCAYFASNVDQDAQTGIQQATAAGLDDFDSDFTYDPNQFKGSANWTGAVGGSFRRVTGHRDADGTWTVTVQVTSLYQFVKDHNFGPFGYANGEMLHQLERDGAAKNYHSIGTGQILYDSSGNFVRVLTPPR